MAAPKISLPHPHLQPKNRMTNSEHNLPPTNIPATNEPQEEALVEILPDGKRWMLWNGKLHREDAPAVIKDNGTQEWWWNGQRHRTNGPAITTANGSFEWWMNGERHREDGPAISDRHFHTRSWMQHGQLHREDGPAIILDDHEAAGLWYWHGEIVSEEEHAARVQAKQQQLAQAKTTAGQQGLATTLLAPRECPPEWSVA